MIRAAYILFSAYPPVEPHDRYREWCGIDTRFATYPFVNVAMDGDADAFMQHLCSQHYGISYGDVRAELETVCRLLDIEAIVT